MKESVAYKKKVKICHHTFNSISFMPINEQIRTIVIKKPCFTVSTSSPHQVDRKQQMYSCSHCSKSFSSPSHLSRHILTHTGEKPCLCSECGQQFSQISSLERHQRTKHNKPNLNKSSTDHLYQCTLCHEYFSLKHNLKMHEKKLHQIQTNFFCNLCSAYFTCKSSLQKHHNFRHRSAVKTQQSTNMSDNCTTMQDDQVRRIHLPRRSIYIRFSFSFILLRMSSIHQQRFLSIVMICSTVT